MPKLSIITINLNNAKGLRKTIESAVSQTSNDFEYIVIDGGSTDGSVEVIKQYSDKITCWVSEPDKGIYNAMNKGIIKATGDYCQFLNSGDSLVSDDVTERMLSDMPDCSILYGNMLKDLDGKIFCNEPFRGREITLLDMFTGTLNHSSAYIKRDLFDKYGLYDESLKIVSDWKFFLITIALNNETLLYKDINVTIFDMNGISHTKLQLRVDERKRVLKELLPKPIYDDYVFFSREGRVILRSKKKRLLWFFIRNIDRLLAKYNYLIDR